LRSARQSFIKFGPYLKDPSTDVQLFVPKSLATTHQYNVKEELTPASKIIEQS